MLVYGDESVCLHLNHTLVGLGRIQLEALMRPRPHRNQKGLSPFNDFDGGFPQLSSRHLECASRPAWIIPYPLDIGLEIGKSEVWVSGTAGLPRRFRAFRSPKNIFIQFYNSKFWSTRNLHCPENIHDYRCPRNYSYIPVWRWSVGKTCHCV
jgi:hypothetical protein